MNIAHAQDRVIMRGLTVYAHSYIQLYKSSRKLLENC